MSPVGTGALLGLLGGTGLAVLVLLSPWRRTPDLTARVAPYLRAAGPRAGDWWREPLRSTGTAVAARLGPGRVVAERLAVLDPGGDAEAEAAQHRAEQVLWAVVGAVLAVLLARVAAGLPPLAVLALLVSGGAGGALARGELLARRVRVRRGEIAADLPDVAELLALSVGAGENVVAALERVSAGSGPLCAQLRHSLGRVRTGTPLLDALVDLAGRWGVAPFTRLVDGIAVAVESGSPLAEVLRAQAADAREAERRRLLETGGRREVQMMVPVVFGVLPVTVVFAVFPGLAQLQLG
ncbi:tight adherence protein C [Kineococcus radiotolerans]|uniref:Tight adherence protein C n=1 Tax=Kineococcus radiotolerans TaxID=131568 RepID=A0A7W4TNI5_KINRA|nr:type II secretion system F family protein [Kineococcus radiotolerans]MBB2902122.1 tight adherence protein C [Kineococcus radiotolerans]